MLDLQGLQHSAADCVRFPAAASLEWVHMSLSYMLWFVLLEPAGIHRLTSEDMQQEPDVQGWIHTYGVTLIFMFVLRLNDHKLLPKHQNLTKALFSSHKYNWFLFFFTCNTATLTL